MQMAAATCNHHTSLHIMALQLQPGTVKDFIQLTPLKIGWTCQKDALAALQACKRESTPSSLV